MTMSRLVLDRAQHRRRAGSVGAGLARRAARLDRRRRSRSRASSPASLIILIILLIVGGSIAWRVIVRRRRAQRRSQKAMTEPAAEESDAPVLKEKMEDALATLQADRQIERERSLRSALVSDHRSARRRQDDGAGQFGAEISARRRQSRRKAVQGVGGTRYCDWWFTDEAVLIDTAGRYTTQDSDAKVDRKSWLVLPRDAARATARASRSTASSSRSASPTCSSFIPRRWPRTPTPSASASPSCMRN